MPPAQYTAEKTISSRSSASAFGALGLQGHITGLIWFWEWNPGLGAVRQNTHQLSHIPTPYKSLFPDRILPHSPGCSETHSNPTVSASWVLGLQVWATRSCYPEFETTAHNSSKYKQTKNPGCVPCTGNLPNYTGWVKSCVLQEN